MLRIKVVEKIETHFVFSNFFFLVENGAVREIMWQNIVEPFRPRMTIWRMRISRWILKATHTRTHNMWHLLVFPLQQRLHKQASLLRYAYIVCHVALFFYVHTNFFLLFFKCEWWVESVGSIEICLPPYSVSLTMFYVFGTLTSIFKNGEISQMPNC
jgi:hypothetical protein